MTSFTQLATIEVLQFDNLRPFSSLTHFVSTRNKVGEGSAFDSFNICDYTGDTSDHIFFNRQLLANALQIDPDRLIVPRQVHGDKIGIIEAGYFEKKNTEEVDAVITDCKGVCLTVSTADCVPILLYCPVKQVIAAVHAGWRGTVKEIAAKSVAQMIAQYGCDPKQIRAAIGPSISPEMFEVGEEVATAFKQAGYETAVVASPVAGKAHVDLWEANRLALVRAGVLDHHIEIAGICTYQQDQRFFSARRLGIHSGRISSGILLK